MKGASLLAASTAAPILAGASPAGAASGELEAPPHERGISQKNVQLVVVVKVKAGQRDAVLKAFKAYVLAVQAAEQGCIEYSAFVDAAGFDPLAAAAGFGALPAYGDDTYVVVQKWESAAHLEAHVKNNAAYTLEYRAKVKDLVESRILHVLSPA